MSSSDLTKKEALELITPVADNEVDEKIRIAFFDYIEHDEEIRNRYQSIKRIKEVVSTRCPCVKAPDSLHQRVHAFLASEGQKKTGDRDSEEPVYDKPTPLSETLTQPDPSQKSGRPAVWKYAAAAAVLIAALIGTFYFYPNAVQNAYNVEEHAYAHFMKNRGEAVIPTIATASLGVAETRLSEVFNRQITVPSLKNAEFKGVVLSDFIPDFKTPMMKYRITAEDQYIYIFAFDIKDLERYDNLARSPEAVKSCVKSKDYHIRNVNGKHVVSWKWDNTWYTAISNHDGETLASLVDSLQ